MKKTIYYFVIILSLLTTISFATTTEYIEYQSGEIDDGSIYLDSYEEYLNAIQGMDEQETYKQEHIQMIANAIMQYELSVRPDVVKAKVLSVEDTEEYYQYDSYGTYKIVYQPISIEILEGEYKGNTYDISYVLTADTYENIVVKEIKANQKINVVIYEDEGEIMVYATTIDASVDRVGYLIALIVTTIIFMIIFIGKKTLKLLPPLILLFDIILLIFVPEFFLGRSIIWLTIVTMILYIITNTVIKVGLNAKTVAAIVATFGVVLVTTLGLILFNNQSTMSGIIYEATMIIESFPKGTIDFNILNLSLYILMATVVVSEVACKTINTYSEINKEETREQIKDYVSENALTAGGVLLITLIPKYLYMLVTKYTYKEIINSEMLINEIARILFLIIAMVITVEVAIQVKKLFVEEDK